ncbi:hypothetical protein VNO80_15999 [Phaseolus coccineus]|uniref:Uncharacterized protein n=1 Tax=Phaseolus coccineus TaxID=3886 RepID=A0AAN9MPW3_PHACN
MSLKTFFPKLSFPNLSFPNLSFNFRFPNLRYEMPVEKNWGKKSKEEGGERRRDGDSSGDKVWVIFSYNRIRRGQDNDQTASNDDSPSSLGDDVVES